MWAAVRTKTDFGNDIRQRESGSLDAIDRDSSAGPVEMVSYDPSIRLARVTHFGGPEAIAWLLTTMPAVRLECTAEARSCAHDVSVSPSRRVKDQKPASASAVLAATLPAGRAASRPSTHCASESP